MRKVYTIAEVVTGRLLGHLECSDAQLASNVPDGCVAVPGRHDPYGLRRDPESGELVELGPELKQARAEEERRLCVQAQIDEIERKSLRRMREVLAQDDPQLKESNQAIEALRARLPRPAEP